MGVGDTLRRPGAARGKAQAGRRVFVEIAPRTIARRGEDERLQRLRTALPRPDVEQQDVPQRGQRSGERRVGKECVSTCRSRGSTTHSKKTTMQDRAQDKRGQTSNS